jgi:hypothetical protein
MWYGRMVQSGSTVTVLAKASRAWLHGLFDLRILATHKSSLISPNLTQKVSKSASEKLKKGFQNFAIISH